MSRPLAAIAALLAVLVLCACESNQSRSAKIGENRESSGKEKSALDVSKSNADIEVKRTALVTSGDSVAVAVELKNNGGAQTRVPLHVTVKDAGGKTVYTNDQAGLAEPLQFLGSIPEGKTVWWINDQLAGARSGEDVDVKVGAGKPASELPVVEFSAIKPQKDADGTYLTGDLLNDSPAPLTLTPISAVALKGDKVVAVGRALASTIPPAEDGVPSSFSLLLIGKPAGAKFEVTAAPKPAAG